MTDRLVKMPWGYGSIDLKDKSVSPALKTQLAKMIIKNEVTTKQVSERSNIPMRTIQRWVKLIADGKKILGSGGQSRLDEISKQVLIDSISSDANYNLSSAELVTIANNEAIETNKRRGKNFLSTKPISLRTFKEYKKTLHIKEGYAEEVTDARVEAGQDIRNQIQFGIMNESIVPLSHEALIINFDATQFKVSDM